jgi:hypothetical protein
MATPISAVVGEKDLRIRIEEAVMKASKNKAVPPKHKHERNIIIESWNERGATLIYAELFKRPLGQKDVVAYKVLVVIHKLLREGHPQVIIDSHLRMSFFEQLRLNYRRLPTEYGRLIANYVTFLIDKINFHHLHPEVDGGISLEKFMQTRHETLNVEKGMTLATHLLDLQKSVLDFQKSVFQEPALTDCKVSAFIPLVIESYAIYTLSVWLLKRIAERTADLSLFSFLTERFYQQYPEIRKFYQDCSNIKYVISIIAVPSLPADPPQFEPGDNIPIAKPKKKRQPKPEPEPEPSYELDLPEQPEPEFNPRATLSPNDLNALFQAIQPVQPVVQAPPQQDWFASMLPPTPVEPPKTEIRTVVKTEIPEEILKKIAELEARIRALEAENSGLKGLLEQLKKEKAVLLKQNANYKQQLEDAEQRFEDEKLRLFMDQIQQASDMFRKAQINFDDPNDSGNQSANPMDVLTAAEEMRQAYQNLLDALNNGGDVIGATRLLAEAASRLLANGKGYAQFIQDPNLRMRLLDAVRSCGDAIARMLENVKKLQGQKPDDAQSEYLSRQLGRLDGHLGSVRSAVDEASSENNLDTGIDLEDLAERELMNAAKMIADAASALEARSRERSKVPESEMTLADSIMGAAMGITSAVQALLQAATEAQQERVRKGRSSDPNAAKYHRDPMWVEGLISAARAVAEATRQLVHCANEASEGRLEEAALIAAARAVTAATQQLVAATRSKSDPFSETQGKLDRAAKAITNATQALVNAAKRSKEDEEKALLAKYENFQGKFQEEFEQTTRIIAMEKQLEMERRVLATMRKGRYADSSAAAPKGPAPEIVNKVNTNAKPQAQGAVDQTPQFQGVGSKTSAVPAYQRKMEESLGRGGPAPGLPKAQGGAPKAQAGPAKQGQQPQAGGLKRADSNMPPRQAPPQTAQYTVQTTTSAPAKQPAPGANAKQQGFLSKEKQMEKFLASNEDSTFHAIKSQEQSNPQEVPEKFVPPPSLSQIREQQERQQEIRKIDQFLFGDQGQIVQQFPPQQQQGATNYSQQPPQQQAPPQQQYFYQPGVQDATNQMGQMQLNQGQQQPPQQPQPARNPYNPFA